MKKLLIVLSLLCATFATAQISDDPWSPNIYKRSIHFRDASDAGDPYIYFDGADVALVGAPLQINANGLIIYQANNDITFETADGVLYLNAPTLTSTNVLTLPEDSGRVDNHNVTSLGTGSFTGTGTFDTVSIPGALSTDYYFLQPILGASDVIPDPQDQLFPVAENDRLVVIRPSSGSSGLTYNWRRFRQ
jgi:hypothetical protein